VNDLTLDLASQHVDRNGRSIELSPRELMLLKVFMREPDRVFSRTELCERVWEHAHEYDTKLVEVFVGRLRKKLGEPQLIRTVRHVGYAISETPSAASSSRPEG
jgi:two-component system OmpR family response regulator/two-component system copper resistance phosphate regulon response regulator CusR